MSCHGCASKFGFWTKENGCPACGFSFCNNCLKNKCAVPKLDNKTCKVCKLCFKSISNPSEGTTENDMSSYGGPPDIFLKRLEALDGPPKPPVIMYQAEPRMRKLIEGLNSTDLEIVRRLEKLREERQAAKSIPTEEEIANRLALLRGQNTDQRPASQFKNAYVPPDSRSAEQQTQDLLTQLKSEVEIDAKLPNLDDEISKRLNRLRDIENSSSKVPDKTSKNTESITLDEIAQLLAQCKVEAAESGKQPDFATIVSLERLRARLSQQGDKIDEASNSDEDDDKAAAKILEKIQSEVDLEASVGIASGAEEVMDVETDDTEEYPWCIICNEDAKVRCFGCDRDLFCKSCFQEGHNDEDSRSHAFELYKRK